MGGSVKWKREVEQSTEEIQEIIQGKYMLNIDSYTAAPVSLFSIVNKAHCQKKDLVNALLASNIWFKIVIYYTLRSLISVMGS